MKSGSGSAGARGTTRSGAAGRSSESATGSCPRSFSILIYLPEGWQLALTDFVVPLRHYESGAQLISVNATKEEMQQLLDTLCL